jgi:hypothetical protein
MTGTGEKQTSLCAYFNALATVAPQCLLDHLPQLPDLAAVCRGRYDKHKLGRRIQRLYYLEILSKLLARHRTAIPGQDRTCSL